MGKIKIGLAILTSIALIGSIFSGVVSAKPENPENPEGEYVQDEIIVKFKGDVEPFRVIKVSEGEVKEKIKEFKKKADVIYAEPNYIAHALWAPYDQYYSYQWHLDNSVYGGINMEAAWDLDTTPPLYGGDPNVVVAIVDTGIAYETSGKYCQAPDLAQTCFVAGYDFVNNDSHPNDDNRHGTHVAGTVAQSTNNNLGVAGVAFNTCLMPVKVLNSRGSGTYDQVAYGIYFAVKGPDGTPNTGDEAKVINLSLGGTSDSQTLKDAVTYASSKGVTVVAACGNDNKPTCLYPAAYDDYVIAVGATQYDETKAPYSSYGPSLDLFAPGGNTSVDQNGDKYADGVLQQTFQSSTAVCTFAYYFFQGTSMATPHVSGVAALLIAKGNATTPDQIRAALQETAEFKVGRDDIFGSHGLVDAYAALKWTAVLNNPPVANNQSVTTDEDTSVAITLSATDLDGDPLTYSIVSPPSNGTLTGIVPNVTYTPNLNYNGLDSFTFKANDGKADSNIATVSITINPVNDAPVANPQSVETTQDAPIAITLTGSDVDNDPLTFIVVTSPVNGTLTGTAPNLIYTPTLGFVGSDSFTFKINDGTVDSNTATVSITVNAVNDPPVANDQSVATNEDTAVAITLIASDVENDPLTYSVVTNPTNGTLSGTAPNLTYTPNLNFNGADSFTFKANDGYLDSNIATVSITVNPVNDVPVANDQSVITVENTPVDITLTASDVDGDALTYSIIAYPSHGTLSGTAPNVTYTPETGYTGLDSFTFKVNDGKVDSNIATISITVNPAAQKMHVGDISMSSGGCILRGFSTWCKAKATITILDSSEVVVGGATVSGSWNGAYSANVSSITGSDGKVIFETKYVKGGGTFTFTVSNVTKEGWIYVSADNVETTDSITLP